MSIVVRHHPVNLTPELYDKSHSQVEALGFPPDGLQLHVCFRADGKWTVSEIWESREQFEAFGRQLMPVLAQAGIQFMGESDILEIHNLVIQ